MNRLQKRIVNYGSGCGYEAEEEEAPGHYGVGRITLGDGEKAHGNNSEANGRMFGFN